MGSHEDSFIVGISDSDFSKIMWYKTYASCVYVIVHIFHTLSHSSENMGCHSYNFKHTFMNMFVTKTQHNPTIYLHTYPT